MAAQVEVQPGEVGRAVAGGRLHLNLTDSSSTNLIDIPAINQARILASEPNKPVTAPKPRLSAKPFAVERNTTIKPILAPKPQSKPRPESTRLPGHKPEPPSDPRPLQPFASGQSTPVSSNPNRPAPTSFKTSNKFNTGQTTRPVAQPFKPAPPFDHGVTNKPSPPVLAEIQKPAASSYAKNLRNLQAAEWSGTTQREEEKGQGAQSKGGTSIARAKSLGFLLDVGLEVEKKAQPEALVQLRAHSRGSRARPVSAIFPDSPSKTEAAAPAPRWAGRRPLSADLTSKFESVGLSLHRKSVKAETQENATEEKSPRLKRAQDNLTPQRSNAAGNPLLTDQSINKAEETTGKETDDDDDDDNKRGVSIKSRISLLLDSSSTPEPSGQGPDVPSPVQPAPEAESTLGVKKLIKQLTEDTTPTQSPVLKPTLKPRPLPLDLTKRFSSERSPDLVSLSEAADRHEIIKDPQRRAEEAVGTPTDQKTFLDSKDSQEQLKKASTPDGPGAAVQTVRASLFENVVERHIVFMMDDVDSHSSPSSKRRDLEDDGSLFIATYKEPVSPSSPRQVPHAFDTVQAIEKNRAVSEIIPSAQWEDKAMTLRSKRSDGSRSVAEGTHPAQGQSASSMTAESLPRYLRVGALPKWDISDQDQNVGLEKGMPEESQREGPVRLLEQDDAAAAPKRLKMLPTEEQSKPRATYFALTGQVQEPFFLGEAGTSIGDLDHSARSGLGGLQGKNLPMRRNPSLEEAYGKSHQSQEKVEELMTKSHLSPRDLIELEKQRLKEKKEREAAEKMRQVALEQEMLRFRELEKGRQREVDLRSVLDDQRKGEMLNIQKKRELQKETERHMAKLKELEKEKQRQTEMEKQAHREFAQMKELEMQREAERQRQKVYEKQKWELEEKQRALEMQKQIELEKQRLQDVEKEKLKELERERQRQLEREKRREAERMQERERQRERERQKQREEERQRELDKESRLLEIQKEKQKMEEMERLKEQQLLEFQKQKEKERQQVIELEKQRMREKKEREQAEKLKQMALEQEILRIRELHKERERQKEMEREHQKEIEREKQRQEQERQQLVELQKQKQREKERQQLVELEKQRLREKREREEAEKIKQMALEQEMLRIRELDKERERLKEIEREKQRVLEQQRQRDLERERQRQLDMQRQEMENQRLRQREQEKEKRRVEELERLKEVERQQLLEFEKRRLREKMEKMEKESAEKMRQIAKQQEAERQRLKERQRKEQEDRLRPESSAMRPKVLDLDSVLRNEPPVKATAQRSDPATRWKEPYKPAILDIDSFTSQAPHSPAKDTFPMSGLQGLELDFGARLQHTPERDASWKVPPQTSGIFSSPVWTTSPQDPWELRPVEMSVDTPVVDQRKQANKQGVRQDEPSRNPQRNWPTVLDQPLNLAPLSGTDARTANTPSGLSSSSATDLIWLPQELQPPEGRGAVHHQMRSQGSQELNRMRSRSVSRRSAPAASSAEGNLSRVRSRSAHREQDRHSWVPQTPGGEEEEGKDSGTPVRDTDSQYGTWETGLRTDDSLTPATPSSESNLSPSPKKPATPGDAPDGGPPSSEDQPLAFPDTPAALLDTSVLRSRAQLGKKRAPRTRPTRAARQTAALVEEEAAEDWLYRDSTEAKPERKEDVSDSEEPARGAEASPAVASQPQRVALFPGMDPSALKAQLKKRGDSDNQVDGAAAASPSQLSRSPKSPFLPRAARVLPPAGGKENGEEDSPQWLKELKSKKRLSQYESES